MDPVAIAVPLRYPPNVIVPLTVTGLFEIVNPVVPPLRPTLVTVPLPGVKLRPTTIVLPVPLSVIVTGAAAANVLEFGNAANDELTVMNEIPLAAVPADPKGSAEMAPVVVRLVVPAWTSGIASSPVSGLAIGSDVMGILDITRMAPEREDRLRAVRDWALVCLGFP